MLDPTDAILNRADVGDWTTTGDPTGGYEGEQPTVIRNETPPAIFQPTDINGLALASVQTIVAPDEPEMWSITLAPTAGMALKVYTGPGAVGAPIRMFPGWALQIPGRGPYLTIVGFGATAAIGTVIASRGVPVRVSGGV